MNIRLLPFLVSLCVLSLAGCATAEFKDLVDGETIDLVGSPGAGLAPIAVSDQRSDRNPENVKLQRGYLMGEKHLIGTPAEAVSLAMAAESEMEYVPASVRNLLRAKPLHLTRFSIEVTPPDKYIGSPIGLVPAVEMVHFAVQAAELASQGGAAVTVRVSMQIGGVEIDGLGYESTSKKVNAAVVRSALERAVNSIVIRVPRPQ